MSTHRIKFGCALAALSLALVAPAAATAAPATTAAPAVVAPTHGPSIDGSGYQYFLRTPGGTHTFNYGTAGDQAYVGDWNGDGADTIAIGRGQQFHISNRNDSVGAEYSFSFGIPGDKYLVGDWDGDGIDTISIQRGSTIFISNAQRPSIADWQFTYGNPGDRMIVGDWDGDGIDTIAIQRGDTYYINNVNGTGVAEYTMKFGSPGDVGIAGDWDGDGKDSIGVFRPNSNMFYLRNSMTSGVADQAFVYGDRGDIGFAGRWSTSQWYDTVGVRRPAPAAAAGTPVEIGQQMAADRGWTGAQWTCLYNVYQYESKWNPSAASRSSSAYGIPQALPGSRMASHGSDWRTNPATQIAWGNDYIAGRYGTPCAAWNHIQFRGWY